MSPAVLLARQIRYENRAFWRNPAAAFFTFAFPLIFMVVFQAIFGTQIEDNGLSAATFYTPAIVAFSIINACFTSLAMTTVAVREEGILKRVRGTPLPAWVYMAARISQYDFMIAQDFRAGFPITFAYGPWHAKIGYEHTSTHLGDEILKAAATGPVVIEIADAAGKSLARFASTDQAPPPDPQLVHPTYWIRPFTRPETAAGMHRFVWDLHAAAPTGAARSRREYPISAIYQDTPGPQGEWMPPGTYTVKLTVNGQTYTQSLTINPDPRK